jgi:hypothetical protein
MGLLVKQSAHPSTPIVWISSFVLLLAGDGIAVTTVVNSQPAFQVGESVLLGATGTTG